MYGHPGRAREYTYVGEGKAVTRAQYHELFMAVSPRDTVCTLLLHISSARIEHSMLSGDLRNTRYTHSIKA